MADIASSANEYLASISHLRPLVQKGYRQRLLVFVEWSTTKQLQLEQITHRITQEFVGYLRESHKPNSHNKETLSTYTLAGYVRVIQHFLHWCLQDEQYSKYVDLTRVHQIRLPKVDRCLVQVFTKEHLDALERACNHEADKHLQIRARAILYVLIDTGIRADELCTLKMAHVHLEPHHGRAKVMGKGRKERQVPLSERARRAMKWYLSEYRLEGLQKYIDRVAHKYRGSQKDKEQLRQRLESNAPFFAAHYHNPLTVSGLESIISRLGDTGNIGGVRCSPHTFRHTFAVQFMRDGGDVYRLMLWMGHASVQATENYLRTIQGWDLISLQLEHV